MKYMAGFAPYPGDSDRTWDKVEATPLWQRINKEEVLVRCATYLGVEVNDIPDDKFEAYRNGYISALYEVRRMMYGLEKGEK